MHPDPICFHLGNLVLRVLEIAKSEIVKALVFGLRDDSRRRHCNPSHGLPTERCRNYCNHGAQSQDALLSRSHSLVAPRS